MEYSITPDETGTYIVLKVIGPLNRQAAMHVILEAHEVGKKLGISRFLSDLTESQNLRSIVDDYELAYQEQPNNPNINRFARIAVLVAPEDHSHDFLVMAGMNAGIITKLFRDRGEAITYLTTSHIDFR